MTPPMLGCVSQRCSSRLSSQPERSIITGPSGRRAVFIRDEMRKETQLKCRSFGRRGPVLIRRKTTLPSQMIWRKEASLISLGRARGWAFSSCVHHRFHNVHSQSLASYHGANHRCLVLCLCANQRCLAWSQRLKTHMPYEQRQTLPSPVAQEYLLLQVYLRI